MIPRHLIIGSVVMLVAAFVAGAYLWQMRGRVKQMESSAAYSRPLAPPVQGPTEPVTLYVAFDDPGVLRAQGANIPLPAGRQQRAQELLSALLDLYLRKSSPHPLAPGSEIREIYLVDPGLAVIDLNAAFANGHRSGVLVEELTVASLTETLAANIPGIARLKILVDGKERETLAGHADLSCFYDVSAVNQLAGQLAAP
ncbi:MAG TPA: GerMN domain-containing protein [Terriglobales bacterium]|nr:GerMN domain-containing protein [Terriglobales bacterium]